MTSKKLLTIAIPTWNRNNQLEKTVAALSLQLKPEVSILILDNCSAKPIEQTLNPELKQWVKIIRHSINIGGCANILRCFELADSEWVWILGDDDEPSCDSIERVLVEIAKYPSCCLIDFGHPFHSARSIPVVAKNLQEAIDVMYYPHGYPELYAWSDGHISNEVLNRKLLLHKIETGYMYIGNFYPHVAMIFSALSDGLPAHFTGPQLAMCRTHEENPSNYTRKDIASGWKQLAKKLSEPVARQHYLRAINSSAVYGEQKCFERLWHQLKVFLDERKILRKLYRSFRVISPKAP